MSVPSAVLGRVAVTGRYHVNFVPTDIGGCVLWLRADKGITLNGSAVSAWNDLSGQGNNCVQATPSNQPTFLSSWSNGLPAVRTTATQWLASLQATSYGNIATIVSAFQVPAGQVIVVDCHFTTGTNYMLLSQAGAKIALQDNSSNLLSVVAAATQSPCSMVAVGALTAQPVKTYYLNGQRIALASVTGSGVAIDGFTVGNQNQHAAGGSTVGEIIVYNRQLTPAEAGALYLYQRAFWKTP